MIHIITGSTLGGAEYVGDHLNDLLQEQGIETLVHNQPEFEHIPAEGTWLVITSTHGAGEFPDNIRAFMSQLANTPPRMSQVKYAVIAIGDSSYDTFCQAGKDAYQLLEDIGATPITDCFEIDILAAPVPEDEAEMWLKNHMAKLS
ncbi:FMN-binding protein MioC [Vibrio hippocampi]|uniref:Protein MioC n=1 Tax=Vibrio hippocampi TaxID=654686 RepID=A0ABM8ZDL6_9VIBR|nr:FMN-binding protein MioC [Vibrio hippocampi]CAH0524282.1 Protein MioC [Vibrio hippocampi]